MINDPEKIPDAPRPATALCNSGQRFHFINNRVHVNVPLRSTWLNLETAHISVIPTRK